MRIKKGKSCTRFGRSTELTSRVGTSEAGNFDKLSGQAISCGDRGFLDKLQLQTVGTNWYIPPLEWPGY